MPARTSRRSSSSIDNADVTNDDATDAEMLTPATMMARLSMSSGSSPALGSQRRRTSRSGSVGFSSNDQISFFASERQKNSHYVFVVVWSDSTHVRIDFGDS